MQLLTTDNVVRFYGVIERGIFPEADPDRELYKITNGDQKYYATVEGFDLHETDLEPPADLDVPGKYCFTEEQGFYLNPDYQEPEPPVTERVAILESVTENMQSALDYIIINN